MNKPEILEGVIPDDDGDDAIKVMSGRLTAAEYARASSHGRQNDADNGVYEFTDEDFERLDEDLWYILSEKLVGPGPRERMCSLTFHHLRFVVDAVTCATGRGTPHTLRAGQRHVVLASASRVHVPESCFPVLGGARIFRSPPRQRLGRTGAGEMSLSPVCRAAFA